MLLLRGIPDAPDLLTLEDDTAAAKGSRESSPERRFVRVPSLRQPGFDAALARALGSAPDGILLSDARGLVEVEHLGAKLAVAEAEGGRAHGSIAVLACVTDSPEGVRGLACLCPNRRLVGLVCDPARLGGALGCGPDAPVIAFALAEAILAAAACEVPALLAVPDDGAEARRRATEAGFRGLLVAKGPALRPASAASGRSASRASPRSSRGSRPA